MSNVISIITECLDLYSLAFCHNKIRLFSSVTLKNVSDFNLKNLELEISSSSEFFTDFSMRIGEIASGRYLRFSQIDLPIDTTKLSYLSTSVTSTVTISIKSQGEILAEKSLQVQLLPYDYVPSFSTYPELLSAFVCPSQADVGTIGDTIHEFLNDASVPANMDMWRESDRETSYTIIRAIYDAVRSLRITFNASPLSLDIKHTRVKLPEALLAYKSGNSLEIALLFASICEYAGYNSFIVFDSGKVYAGAFFTQNTLKSPIIDDGKLFSELTDGINHDCCIIDPSSLVNGTNISFEDSAKMAHKSIDVDNFPIIIDVKECRRAGIYSIHNRIVKDGNIIFEEPEFKAVDRTFEFPANTTALANRVKNSIAKITPSSSLVSSVTKDAVFLVGSGKSISTKFVFNARVVLKSFSVSGIVSQEHSEMLATLIKLNENSDLTDVSDSVSTLYEKDKFNKKLIKLCDSEKSKKSLYLAFGLVSGEVNGNVISAPLFLTPATLVYDNQAFYLSISKASTVLNKAVFDYLRESIGFTIPFDIDSFDYLEDYDDVTKKLHNESLRFEHLDFLDAVFLTKTPLEYYLASTAATPSYFNKSNLIECLIKKSPIESHQYETVCADKMQPNFYSMPLLLDATQADAYNCAMSNTCSVICGPNGSGKTRVAASIAFSEVNRGNTVLYVSATDSNIRKFNSYSQETGLNEFTVNISKNNLQKNMFDTSIVHCTDIDELSSLKSDTENKHAIVSNYYSALHKVREIGFSLYEAVSQYERYKTFPYSVNFTNSEVAHLSKEDVVRWFDVVANLAKAGADCHEPFNNPLMYIKCRDFSYDLKSDALIKLTEYKEKTCKFITTQTRLVETLGIEVSVIREAQTANLISLSELLLNKIEYIYPTSFNKSGIDAEFLALDGFLESGVDFFKRKEFIDTHFLSDVLSLDVDLLLGEWRNAALKFAIARASSQNTIKNRLKVFARDSKFVTVDNTMELLSEISAYKSDLAKISEISSSVRQIFGIDLDAEISRGNKEIFTKLKESIDSTREYYRILLDIYSNEKKPKNVLIHNESIFTNKERFISDFSEMFECFSRCKTELDEIENEISLLLELDIERAKKENSKIWYYFIEKFIDRMLENLDLLKHWCAWNVARDTAEKTGLGALVSLYTSEQMTYNDIRNAFLKGFFKTVSEYILSCEPDINNFSKSSFEKTENSLLSDSEKYRTLYKSVFSNNVSEIISKNLSDSFSSTLDEALMLIRRDFSFNDKYYNVSEKSKSILHTVKPCTVAKGLSYLFQIGSELNHFDCLVVDTVDEFTWEELALLIPLAKRIVLLAENLEGNKLAKLLTERGGAFLSLSWIYSYNFSTRLANKIFYPQSTTFVFSDDTRRGVRVVRQKANYDRRNTRTNFIEASAVVDEIMKKLDVSFSSSISIIAITDEQARLIELLFTKRLQSLSENQRKAFFDRTEHFSISSLEKAEFTPSDTVIFSTTFSVEEKPKYNDSFTKTIPEFSSSRIRHSLINTLLCAQNEFVLVTSLEPEMLEKFKTVIPTYAMFKDIVISLSDTTNTYDSEMNKVPRIENSVIRQVINHIEGLGYRADIDIGTNSCRVDIAVRKNNGSGYLFGIIFDESAYMYGGDLISRALIRKNLVENLGWKIIRIYTVEWFENSPKQLDLITEMLKGGEEKKSINLFDGF